MGIELADAGSPPVPVPRRFLRARVLALWTGVPVGIVEISVRDGAVHRADVLRVVQEEHPHALPREAVRRALLSTGIAARIDPAALFRAPAEPKFALPRITVLVCTRDRTEELAACLESLHRCDPPPFEVIVVDNVPATDGTHRLVHERFRSFHYVCEQRPGLDWARNRGIAEANGDIIAFTDDDVVVDSGWIGALGHAFAADPAVGLVTGLAEPFELETRAQDLFERYGGFGRGCRRTYSQTPRSGSLPWTLVGAGQLGAGANMAFRREVFERVGLFDPALDVGTPTLGGGDHDMFFRVLHAGYLCVYEPSAVVRHRHRRTMRELRRLLYCYGHATRCFFEREALNFPADRPAIRRLRRWWWRHWAFARWWRAAFRPPLLPAALVWDEIRGFLTGRGAYDRARARIVPDESVRADQPRASAPGAPPLPAVGVRIAVVDVSSPLRDLEQSRGVDAVHVVVQWRRRPLGTVRIASHGAVVSARRLADEISHALWHRLLDPLDSDSARVAVEFHSAFADCVSAEANPVPSGEHVPGGTGVSPVSAMGILPVPGHSAHHPEAERSCVESLAVARTATIVVTTCDRPDALRRCLASLAALETHRPVQIIVVDNRPQLGRAAAVVHEFPGVELVLEPRAGSSRARNAGIAAARGEFIAMVDDDMTVAPDWLERLLAPFARADVMAVTGNTLAGRLETAAEQWLEVYGGFCRGFVARDFGPAWFHRRRWRAVPTWQIGGSGNAAFRRRIFSLRPIGGFTPLLGAGVPTGVGEDTKLFYDLLHAGYTIAYEPAAVAWHFHRATMPELRRQLYAYSRGHVAYHLITFFQHRDGRALVRVFAELPGAFLSRAWERARRRYRYPWSLLLVELAGTFAGPWSLWRAHRLARRTEQHAAARERAAVVAAASTPLTSDRPALGVPR